MNESLKLHIICNAREKTDLIANFPVRGKTSIESILNKVKDFFKRYVEKWNMQMSVKYKNKIIFDNISVSFIKSEE